MSTKDLQYDPNDECEIFSFETFDYCEILLGIVNFLYAFKVTINLEEFKTKTIWNFDLGFIHSLV